MPDTSKPFIYPSIGRLAPLVLVLLAFVDVALRFVPLSCFSHRAWEAMRYKHAPGAPFRANQVYHNDRCYGDLGSTANVPALRHYHPETFTTDAYGYRNRMPLTPGKPPAGLLIGSSYSVGCGVNDDETLSEQLSRLVGCSIYNFAYAAGPERRLDNIRACARRLHMTSGTVLYEYLNSHDPLTDEGFIQFLKQEYPSLISANAPTPDQRALIRPQEYPTLNSYRAPSWQEQIRLQVQTFIEPLEPWSISRLQIITEHAHKWLENNWFFPNFGISNVGSVQRLINGGYILFQGIGPAMAQPNRDANWSRVYFSWLARELSRDNLSLLVFLVPYRNTVYGPLLVNQSPRLVGPDQSAYLAYSGESYQ